MVNGEVALIGVTPEALGIVSTEEDITSHTISSPGARCPGAFMTNAFMIHGRRDAVPLVSLILRGVVGVEYHEGTVEREVRGFDRGKSQRVRCEDLHEGQQIVLSWSSTP